MSEYLIIIALFLSVITIICFVSGCVFIHDGDWFGIPLIIVALIALIGSMAIFTHRDNRWEEHEHHENSLFWEDYPSYHTSHSLWEEELERQRLAAEAARRQAEILAEEHRQCLARIDANYNTTATLTPGERAIYDQMRRQEEQTC